MIDPFDALVLALRTSFIGHIVWWSFSVVLATFVLVIRARNFNAIPPVHRWTWWALLILTPMSWGWLGNLWVTYRDGHSPFDWVIYLMFANMVLPFFALFLLREGKTAVRKTV